MAEPSERTPEERECDAMLARVRDAWPRAERVAERDLRVLVRAARRMVDDRDVHEALEFLLCRHPLAWAVRPPVLMLFRALDEQVGAAPLRPS